MSTEEGSSGMDKGGTSAKTALVVETSPSDHSSAVTTSSTEGSTRNTKLTRTGSFCAPSAINYTTPDAVTVVPTVIFPTSVRGGKGEEAEPASESRDESEFLEELWDEGKESSLHSALESSRYDDEGLSIRGLDGAPERRESLAFRRTGIRRPTGPEPRHLLFFASAGLFILVNLVHLALELNWPIDRISLVWDKKYCSWTQWRSVSSRNCTCNDTITRFSNVDPTACPTQTVVCAATPCPQNVSGSETDDLFTKGCLCWRKEPCEIKKKGNETFKQAYAFLDRQIPGKESSCPPLTFPLNTTRFKPCPLQGEDKLDNVCTDVINVPNITQIL